MLTWFNHLKRRRLSEERPHLLGTNVGSDYVRAAVGILIGSLFLASALMIRVAGAHTTHVCPCRYPGGIALPGAVICLEVDGKRSLARCEMVLNNSSWRFLGEPCPIAALTTPIITKG
jgi:hypothetical protein